MRTPPSRFSELSVEMYPDTRGSNPYLQIMADGLSSLGATVTSWDVSPARRDGVNVVYLHWPERLFARRTRHPRNRIQRRRQRQAALHALHQRREDGARIVWTAHNVRAHDWEGTDRTWDRRTAPLLRLLDGVVHLSHASREQPAFGRLGGLPSVVVPHPHYELVAADHHAGQAGRIKRVLLLGAISARKNYIASVESALAVPGLGVIIAGGQRDRQLAAELRTLAAAHDGRLELVDRRLSDEEVNGLFDGHTATLLNQPTALNSGVMFLALSRGSPVVCPATAANRELQGRYGDRWLRTFSAPLSAAELDRAVYESVPERLPDLSESAPAKVSERIAEFFLHLHRC